MSKLEELIQKLCPNGVPVKTLKIKGFLPLAVEKLLARMNSGTALVTIQSTRVLQMGTVKSVGMENICLMMNELLGA